MVKSERYTGAGALFSFLPEGGVGLAFHRTVLSTPRSVKVDATIRNALGWSAGVGEEGLCGFQSSGETIIAFSSAL